MTFDVDRLLRLWSDPIPDDAAAQAAFAELYTDPVTVNGMPLTTADLVARARALQAAFDPLERELLQAVEADGTVAVAFRLGGRQVGTLGTAAGPLPPTGRRMELRVIDVLTLTGGRISSIWMAADELGALAAAGAVRLVAGDQPVAASAPRQRAASKG
jgi:ketosteroid isomerase-like protein